MVGRTGSSSTHSNARSGSSRCCRTSSQRKFVSKWRVGISLHATILVHGSLLHLEREWFRERSVHADDLRSRALLEFLEERDTTFLLNAQTKKEGELKAGEKVTVRYKIENGKDVATMVSASSTMAKSSTSKK